MWDAATQRKRAGWWWALLGLGAVLCLLLLLPYGWAQMADAGAAAVLAMLTGDSTLWLFLLVGFLAQMIDGATSMGYGVVSSASLLAAGVPPAAASTSVHLAKVVTNGMAGLAHWRMGNVNPRLLRVLVIYGVVGAVMGALLLSHTTYTGWIKPVVAVYLLIMGVRIVTRSLKPPALRRPTGRLALWAWLGGLLDAIGGGGWGPVVGGYLANSGRDPRYAVGSSGTAEFFVALASSLTLVLSFRGSYGSVLAGLLLGGLAAAPLAARVARWLPRRQLLLVVGLALVAVNIRTLVLALL